MSFFNLVSWLHLCGSELMCDPGTGRSVSFPGSPADFYQNQTSDFVCRRISLQVVIVLRYRADRVRHGDQGSWVGNSHWELSQQTVLKLLSVTMAADNHGVCKWAFLERQKAKGKGWR